MRQGAAALADRLGQFEAQLGEKTDSGIKRLHHDAEGDVDSRSLESQAVTTSVCAASRAARTLGAMGAFAVLLCSDSGAASTSGPTAASKTAAAISAGAEHTCALTSA